MKHCYVIPAMTWVMALSATASSIDVPFIKQKKNGCGAASVAMVAEYWENRSAKPINSRSHEQIYQQLYNPNRNGILLADMKGYLEDIGLRAFTFRGQWEDLAQHLTKGRPIIVGLKKGRAKRMHFAVLSGVEGDHVWLNDPTRKKANRQSQAEFLKQWASADHWMLLATPGSRSYV